MQKSLSSATSAKNSAPSAVSFMFVFTQPSFEKGSVATGHFRFSISEFSSTILVDDVLRDNNPSFALAMANEKSEMENGK